MTKPHIRLHYFASGHYCAEMALSWTPSYMGRSGTAREALESVWAVWNEKPWPWQLNV
jgi:hypothetical protein